MSYIDTVIMLLYTTPFTIYSQQRCSVTPFFCVMVSLKKANINSRNILELLSYIRYLG